MIDQPLLRQFRLWAVFAVVVPGLLIMLVYSFGQFATAKKEKLVLLSQRTEFQQRLIERWLEERKSDIRSVSRLVSSRTADWDGMERTLQLLQKEYQEFDSLSYVDHQGVFRVSTLRSGIRFPSAAAQPYFEAAKAGREFVSDITVGRNSGLPLLNFSVPVYDREARFSGLILGSVKTAALAALLRSDWGGQSGESLLINRDGILVVRPPDAVKLLDNGLASGALRMKLNRPDAIFGAAHLGESGSGGGVNHRGDRVLGAYRYLPEQEWTLIGSVEEREVLQPIYRQLLVLLGVNLLLVLAMLPLLNLLISRITQPVEWLIGQAQLVAAGNYQMTLPSYLRQIPRELANLCLAFVAMSQKLQSSVRLVREHEARLETKVQEIESVNSSLQAEITERQDIQAALEESNAILEMQVGRRTGQLLQREQYYRRLLENLPYCIGRYNRRYERIYANQAALLDAAMPESLAIDACREAAGLPADVYLSWAETLSAVFAAGKAAQFESRGGSSDWKRFYEVCFIPEHNLRQEVVSVLCVAADITEKRRLEADMARLGLLDIVGEMAVGIGHEVRNPMTMVRGYLQLFEQKELFAPYHSQIHEMIAEVDKVNSIIGDFLTLAKNKAVKMQRGSLNRLLETLFPLLEADASHRGHEIRLELGDIPASNFDETEIRQMTLNLVHNGLEAMSRGGVITVSTMREGAHIVLSVSDTGEGIRPEVLDKLGTPFVTSKDLKTGLGLPVCFRIAQRHQASIDVETGAQGTTFRIAFPAADAAGKSNADVK
ncbi:MAG: cache domain-containing protein [Sporomusaceae bacterium]|nr:cache domain-containing protein [Sporomusaceae bacterium]